MVWWIVHGGCCRRFSAAHPDYFIIETIPAVGMVDDHPAGSSRQDRRTGIVAGYHGAARIMKYATVCMSIEYLPPRPWKRGRLSASLGLPADHPAIPAGTSSSIVASHLDVREVGRVRLTLDRPRAPAALPPSRWLPPAPTGGGIIGIGLYY